MDEEGFEEPSSPVHITGPVTLKVAYDVMTGRPFLAASPRNATASPRASASPRRRSGAVSAGMSPSPRMSPRQASPRQQANATPGRGTAMSGSRSVGVHSVGGGASALTLPGGRSGSGAMASPAPSEGRLPRFTFHNIEEDAQADLQEDHMSTGEGVGVASRAGSMASGHMVPSPRHSASPRRSASVRQSASPRHSNVEEDEEYLRDPSPRGLASPRGSPRGMSRASNRTGSPKYSVASLRLAISATPAAPPAVPSSPAARAYSPKFSSASTLATSPRYSGPNVIYNINGHLVSFVSNSVLLTASGWKSPDLLTQGDVVYLDSAAGGGNDPVEVQEVTSRRSSQAEAAGVRNTVFVAAVLQQTAPASSASVSVRTYGGGGSAGGAGSSSPRHARSPKRASVDSTDILPVDMTAEAIAALSRHSHHVHQSAMNPAGLHSMRVSKKAASMWAGTLKLGVTTPANVGSVRQGKAFLIRPPEGMCGIGNHRSPVWPAKVSCNTDGSFKVLWECCLYKGLASNQMIPSHHSNKTLSPVDCPIIAEVDEAV